jgi:hypothetical protein
VEAGKFLGNITDNNDSDNFIAGWHAGDLLGKSGSGLSLNNVYIGSEAGRNIDDDNGSVIIGFRANKQTAQQSVNGSGVYIGFETGKDIIGARNTVIGSSALRALSSLTAINAQDNVVYGGGAMSFVTSANRNTVSGRQAGSSQTSDTLSIDDNVYFGYQCGRAFGVNTGDRNSFFGTKSGFQSVGALTGSDNVYGGYEAGADSNGNFCVYLGSGASKGKSGDNRIMLGQEAGVNYAGDYRFMISGGSDNRDAALYGELGGFVGIKSQNFEQPDIEVIASSFIPYLDQATNTLKFKVRYSDGTTIKIGSVALV